MTRLAKLIATQEGFFVPGSLPERRNNPGDLRHSPHSSHEGIGPDDIGIIDTVEHGWEDLERQLRLYAARGMSLREAIYSWAPPADRNDTPQYLNFVVAGLGKDVTPDTSLLSVLTIEEVPDATETPAAPDVPATTTHPDVIS
jgi:hypothetical protein